MSDVQIDQELNRAFNLWSQVSGIEFEQIKEPIDKRNKRSLEPDIDIRFETGYHGDAEPFDGTGLILGNFLFL